MSGASQLVIVPYAHASSEGCTEALRGLRLPVLRRLAARWAPGPRDEGDDFDLLMPHERALAAARGWSGDQGALPFAAHAARADGIDTGESAWGLLTPAHWHVGRDQITLLDPAELDLPEAESRAFLEAVRPLFESEGIGLAFGAPLRWYAAHDTLAGLACASLDRVIARNVDAWLPGGPQARLFRRLQNEVQMLLYRSPLNEAREARGAMPVNSFWLSGCGRFQPSAAASTVRVLDTLRAPALRQDWAAWGQAWQALDAGPLAELATARHTPAVLTLCGERHAQSLLGPAVPAWRAWARAWHRTLSTDTLLGTL